MRCHMHSVRSTSGRKSWNSTVPIRHHHYSADSNRNQTNPDSLMSPLKPQWILSWWLKWHHISNPLQHLMPYHRIMFPVWTWASRVPAVPVHSNHNVDMRFHVRNDSMSMNAMPASFREQTIIRHERWIHWFEPVSINVLTWCHHIMRFTVLKCCFQPACEWFQLTVIFRPDGMVMIMFSYHVPIVISMSPFYYPADCAAVWPRSWKFAAW